MWKAAGGKVWGKKIPWCFDNDMRGSRLYWTPKVKGSPGTLVCLESNCQHCGHQQSCLKPFKSPHFDKTERSQKNAIREEDFRKMCNPVPLFYKMNMEAQRREATHSVKITQQFAYQDPHPCPPYPPGNILQVWVLFLLLTKLFHTDFFKLFTHSLKTSLALLQGNFSFLVKLSYLTEFSLPPV